MNVCKKWMISSGFTATIDFNITPKLTVSSNWYTVVLLSTKTRSVLIESPVMKDGDGKEGRSAYNEAFIIDDKDSARYEGTVIIKRIFTQDIHFNVPKNCCCEHVSCTLGLSANNLNI